MNKNKLGEVLENCQTILNVNEEHKLTEKKFYKRLVSLKANFGYDFLTTVGWEHFTVYLNKIVN